MESQVQLTLQQVQRILQAQQHRLTLASRFTSAERQKVMVAVLAELKKALAAMQDNLGKNYTIERDLALARPYFKVAGCLERTIQSIEQMQTGSSKTSQGTKAILALLEECLSYLPALDVAGSSTQPLDRKQNQRDVLKPAAGGASAAASASEESTAQVDRIRLLQIVKYYFDKDELRELSFYLNVDYDQLSGENKRGKAIALLEYLERRGQIRRLEEMVRRLRPHAFE
jgi:hypothetical protein